MSNTAWAHGFIFSSASPPALPYHVTDTPLDPTAHYIVWQTNEGDTPKILAALQQMLPRLKRLWSHLDRQRGGGTQQRDAGETQLEMDQRKIRDKIAKVRRDLAEVVAQRATQRKQRKRIPLPTFSIVGYTNAGKSSLLNKLTGAEVLAADKLFATLDPTTRRLALPSGRALLLTDTVGFVRRLPHRLVEAFKATLEEAVQADFLVHVIDLVGRLFGVVEARSLVVLVTSAPQRFRRAPEGTSPTPVLPEESVRMTMLRVKKGPCAPLKLSSMPSWPATGITCMRVTVGVGAGFCMLVV